MIFNSIMTDCWFLIQLKKSARLKLKQSFERSELYILQLMLHLNIKYQIFVMIIFWKRKNKYIRSKAVDIFQRTVQASMMMCRQVELELRHREKLVWCQKTNQQTKTLRTLPPDLSCPLEKAPLGSPQCPQWQCLLSWSPSPQTLFTRNNASHIFLWFLVFSLEM